MVLIADVSGSMEAYSRAYLYLLHGSVKALRAETFVFATQLARLTRRLRVSTADPEQVLRAWSPTSRTGRAGRGSARRCVQRPLGRRAAARGAVVVIVSDGWESGDPGELGEQMARLANGAA